MRTSLRLDKSFVKLESVSASYHDSEWKLESSGAVQLSLLN
jgi:hypothetical protein